MPDRERMPHHNDLGSIGAETADAAPLGEALDELADAPFRETPHEPTADEARTDAPVAPSRATGTLHMIGNSHIDPVWLWHWQEGFQEVKSTFRSALERMREYPDFRFCASSAAFYRWVEENEPETFREIQERVAEGRWSIVGGWWIEPDCNLPSGESFARQALHGQRYYLRAFGRTTQVGYNPDAFGHTAGLPQILLRSGLPYYTFMRPQVHEKELPRLFRWRSADGSEVLAFRIMFEYCTWPKELHDHVARCLPELGAPHDQLMVFYGVGNHGGGPTRANIDSIHELDRDPAMPALVLSTPEAYFDALSATEDRAAIPMVTGDLQRHAPGCYAAHSSVKRWNRRAENLLLAAERWSAVAREVTGLAYPTDDLARAWQDVLFNQFHDILAGSAIEPSYEDTRDAYGEAFSIGARALNGATQSIARAIRIDPATEAWPIVVFNAHAWATTVPVELESGGLQPDDVLLDDDGQRVAFQMVRSHATVSAWRRRVTFVAELPALGYRVFHVRRGVEAAELPSGIAVDRTVLAGRRFRLELDPATGTIRSLRDLRHGHEVFSGPAARPVVLDDPSDTWGHGLVSLHDEVGTFEPTSVRVVEEGAVQATIRVESAFGASRLVQAFTMYRGLDRVDVAVTVDWRERHRALKLRFPVAVTEPHATWDVAYAQLERAPNGEEVPGQQWFDVSGEAVAGDGSRVPYGVSILNDAKYSYDVDGTDMGLTVLRSPIFAHHDPFVPAPDGVYRYQDQGIQDFRYTIVPHDGDWRDGGTVRRAAELNQPPIAILESFHDGALAHNGSFLDVSGDGSVDVAVVKGDEDDSGAVVIRAWETGGRSAEARIGLLAWGRSIERRFGPGEIVSFLVPRDPARPVEEIDLIERPLASEATRANV